MEDEKIVELFLERDEAAIQYTAEKYGPRLRALAQSILEDAETAEECENDTYMKAWSSIPPNEPRTYLYPYLARITRHLALDCCRRQSRLKRDAHITALTQELEACIPGPGSAGEHLDGVILGQVISAFLRGLPQQQRNIFLRRYWYLDSVDAIAGRFAVSESKVKSVLFRCRNALRSYLEKEGYTL